MPNIYQFTVNDSYGRPKSLADYRGKVLLVVNTASRCGFTPQYKELQDLYDKYREQGFEILDFPCNQFNEAPENALDYMRACKTKFGTEFTIFEKIDVNGDSTHPLYVYLKQQQPEDQYDSRFSEFVDKLIGLGITPRGDGDIKWNFTKFLLDSNGVVKGRYSPCTTPMELETHIQELLNLHN